MTFLAKDAPEFVGESWEAPMVLQDAQRLINWYIQMGGEGAKMPKALLACPGLNLAVSLNGGANQVRGCWVLPGNTQALVVSGSSCYIVTATAATGSTPASFAAKLVGFLNTNTGPVCIRDNGVLVNGLGGYAVIVDGPYCYYYLLSGATYKLTFTANVVGGSNIISFTGTVPNGIIVASNATIYDGFEGAILPTYQIVSVNTIALTATMSQPAIGTIPNDTITMTIPAFGQITDSGFLGPRGWLS